MFCESDRSGPELMRAGEENPLLWLCGADVATKIENGKPELNHKKIVNFTEKIMARVSPKWKLKNAK